MFKFEYEPHYSDYRNFDFIKVSTALDLIQEAAVRDSESAGYSVRKLSDMNLAWLLFGYNLHFEKPILTKYPLTAFTAVKKVRASISERGTILYQNNIPVAKSIASWFMFNTAKMRPERIPDEILESYGQYDFGDDFFDYKKVQLLSPEGPDYTVTVSNKDIDTNRHLNNVKGAEILTDALPFDFFFTDMNVVYKKQSRLHDKLGVFKKELENGFYVHLENEQNEVCVAGTFLKN